MVERLSWIIFYTMLFLFVLNEALEASTLTWQDDVSLNEYRQAGHLTGYKVFFKITENCNFEESYNYSVDVGDQTSLELTDNKYFIPGHNYKFQIKSYAVVNRMLIESEISEVVGCFKPRPLTGVEQLELQQQDLKKKSTTREK